MFSCHWPVESKDGTISLKFVTSVLSYVSLSFHNLTVEEELLVRSVGGGLLYMKATFSKTIYFLKAKKMYNRFFFPAAETYKEFWTAVS